MRRVAREKIDWPRDRRDARDAGVRELPSDAWWDQSDPLRARETHTRRTECDELRCTCTPDLRAHLRAPFPGP